MTNARFSPCPCCGSEQVLVSDVVGRSVAFNLYGETVSGYFPSTSRVRSVMCATCGCFRHDVDGDALTREG